MNSKSILVVDDEQEIRELIKIFLEKEGYNVVLAQNGEEALKALEEIEIHLIILDIMMPKLDGIETCMKIREEKNMPIIMLSAKSQDIDKIMGLTIGADDYMTKPFNPLELVVRVKAQIGRYVELNTGTAEYTSKVEVNDLVINIDRHEVTVKGKNVTLTPTEFEILELLARNKGIVFSIEKIYERVWKEDFFDSNNTVVVHIRRLREKIEENPRRPQIIKTVWGVGYKVDK